MEEKLLSKLKKVDHLVLQMIFKDSNNDITSRPPSRTQATILEI